MDIRPGLYRHFKGKLYRVEGMARHSESLEEMVVYRALVVFEGVARPRFEYMGEGGQEG